MGDIHTVLEFNGVTKRPSEPHTITWLEFVSLASVAQKYNESATDPKAMPDEVDKAKQYIDDMKTSVGFGKMVMAGWFANHWPNVLAHITAQAEKIALLEGAAIADEQRLQDAGHRVDINAGCDTPEMMADRILELKADNKRLQEKWAKAESARLVEVMQRKLSEPCENCEDTGLYSVGCIDNMPCPCKAALAQKAESGAGNEHES